MSLESSSARRLHCCYPSTYTRSALNWERCRHQTSFVRMVRFADEVQPAQEDPEHSEHPDHAENKVLSRLRHEGAKRTPLISDEQCPSDGEGGRKGEGPSQSRSQSEAEDVPNELRSAKSKKKAHRQVHRQATWLRIDKFGNTSLVSTGMHAQWACNMHVARTHARMCMNAVAEQASNTTYCISPEKCCTVPTVVSSVGLVALHMHTHTLHRTTTRADKWRTALKLGVRARDLRLLEPGLASLSPPAILDRERAIVVQLGDAAKW